MLYTRRGISTVDESDIVGFKVERTQLASQLTDGDAFSSRKVISIFGMGGLGKTTLARVLFNEVSDHFKARVWITVSQKYDARELLLTALKQLIGESDVLAKMNYRQVEEKLCEHLEDKRYLVVIDDLWKVGSWERISLAFPKKMTGSRIILTTRNKEVALHAATSREHHLELSLLGKNERWELFCRKVFSVSGGACPEHLTEVGMEIVEKCGGLPLAIVVIGGLLMGKERTISAWSKVRDSAKWQLSQDSNLCRETLMYSYNDLPQNLKACFLYLGLFPEDYEIQAERLLLLWVSEGFVQARGEENPEDVAEDCLEELIQRSMIQVTKRKYLEGPVLSCRVHDLLRDLAISESRKDKFMDFHTSNNHYSMSTHGKLRRFAIHSTTTDEHEDQCYNTITTYLNLRSLFLFRSSSLLFANSKSISRHGTKMLRVLDMYYVNLGKVLPKEIGNLFFLQYLRLGTNRQKSLPNSIGKLVNLQTLDFQDTVLLSLPKTIWKLKNLRHLYLNLDCTISWHVAKLCRLNDFGRNLLTLRVGNDMWRKISDVLVRTGCLRSLYVLGATIENGFPLSLTDLTLVHPSLKQDPSGILGSLPKLKSLVLDRSSDAFEMVSSREEFSQLEFVELSAVANLTKWRVKDGALPSLKELKIRGSRSLKKFPDGLKNISSLQKITIEGMPKAFIDQVQGIITQVPTIHIHIVERN